AYAGPDAGATVLATTNGAPTAVSSPEGAGRGVYLGPIYSGGTSSYANGELRSGSADRLLEQAVALAAPGVRGAAVAPRPRTTAVSTVGVSFTNPIAAGSFDAADVTLIRDGGPNLNDGGITIAPASDGTYQLGNLDGLTAMPGTYTLTVSGAGVLQADGT